VSAPTDLSYNKDPKKSNEVLNAKIWWNWLVKNSNPWAQLWNKKYASKWNPQHFICYNQSIQGSLIWNATNLQRDLIQQHSLWEICDKTSIEFWVDSWQQIPSLDSLHPLPNLQDLIQSSSRSKVNDFWEPGNQQDFKI
jgi:hypothetical protein